MCDVILRVLADVALSNTLKRFNYILETVFQHAEKWEAPDIKETGKVLSYSKWLYLLVV